MLLVLQMLSKVNESMGPRCTEVQTQVGLPTAKAILLKPIELLKLAQFIPVLLCFGGWWWYGICFNWYKIISIES